MVRSGEAGWRCAGSYAAIPGTRVGTIPCLERLPLPHAGSTIVARRSTWPASVFSFFRKDKPEDLMAFLREGQHEFASGPTYTLVDAASREVGIEVQETRGGLVQEFEEAAVLYANGKVGEAAALLNRYLLEHPDNTDPLPWFMLFDLYEASKQPEAFEDAAVDFAVKFERSPPTWAPRGQLQVAALSVPLMSYGEKFGGAEQLRLQRFLQDARDAPFVRVEVSRCPAPGDAAARSMLATLDQVEGMSRPLELIGGAGFAVRLGAAHQGGRLGEAGWLLWLAVLRLQGKEADFEEVAAAYAVSFERSPPAFRPPLALPGGAGMAGQGAASAAVFHLSGVLGPGCEITLGELSRYAVGRKQIDIDLSQVPRIDFAAVGLLLETLIHLGVGQRTIHFRDGNEMVNTLLKVVGASQFAPVHARTRV